METKRFAFLVLVMTVFSLPLLAQDDTYPPDREEKKAVIDSVSKWLREYYIFS